MDKKSFKLYKEWSSQFLSLDNETAGELIKAVFTYQTSGNVPEKMSPVAAMAFSFIGQQFDRDDDSYDRVSKARSEAGKKGGAPKGNKNAVRQEKEFYENQNKQKQANVSKNNQNKLKEEEEVEVEAEEEDNNTTTTDVVVPASDYENLPPLPLNDGTEYRISQREIEQFQALYPGVDVLQQVRNMAGWLIANDRNRKTRAGIKRFIAGWLSREQDKAPRGNVLSHSPPQNPIDRAFSELDERRRRGEL